MTLLTFNQKDFLQILSIGLVIGLLAIPWLGQPSQVEAKSPGYNGRIVLTSERDGNTEIYTMEADGSNIAKLTNDSSHKNRVLWSPDGSKISFAADRSGQFDTWVMDANGENQIKITDGNVDVLWSPDSTQIAYADNVDGLNQVFLVEPDGSNRTQITHTTYSTSPAAWSPDGAQILLNNLADNSLLLYSFESGEITTLATNRYLLGGVSWSIDGNSIAYSKELGDSGVIYTVDTSTGQSRRLTDSQGVLELNPVYSWDGQHIYYFSVDSASLENWSLVTSKLDGTVEHEVDLTSIDFVLPGVPFLSPDGISFLLRVIQPGFITSSYFIDWETGALSSFPDDSTATIHDWLSIPNAEPDTTDDALIIPSGTSSVISILANDTDEEPLDGQYVTIAAPPSHGQASVVDGKVRYTPAEGYVGSDELTYQVCDSFLLDQKCTAGVLGITVETNGKPQVVITKIGEQTYTSGAASYAAKIPRPTFSGTASPGATITIEIHSDPIVLTTIADADGKWTVTPDQNLPAGNHTVLITATKDGVTTTLDSFVLAISDDSTSEIPRTGTSTSWMRIGGLLLLLIGIGLWLRSLYWHKMTAIHS